jgi:hypothetical protein
MFKIFIVFIFFSIFLLSSCTVLVPVPRSNPAYARAPRKLNPAGENQIVNSSITGYQHIAYQHAQ